MFHRSFAGVRLDSGTTCTPSALRTRKATLPPTTGAKTGRPDFACLFLILWVQQVNVGIHSPPRSIPKRRGWSFGSPR
jgi:hypothetical protein